MPKLRKLQKSGTQAVYRRQSAQPTELANTIQPHETECGYDHSSPMPHYYLHLMNGTGFTEDREGADYASIEVAREKAILGLRDVIAGEVLRGDLNLGSNIEIDDERHAHVMTVHLNEAIQISSQIRKRPNHRYPTNLL